MSVSFSSFQPSFLHIYFLLIPLSSPFGIPRMQMLERALNVFPEVCSTILIYNFFFSFCCSDWVIFTILFSRLLICSLVLTYLLFDCFLMYSLFQLLYSNSLLKCSLSSSILLSSVFSILMTLCLNSLSVKLLISILLGFFPGVFSCSSFGVYSSVSPFCLTFCVCSYNLYEIAVYPNLENVASV